MPELRGFIPPTTVRQKEDGKQAQTLALLILVLLGLVLVWWVLTRPAQIVGAKPTRGITNVFTIYGTSRNDLLKRPNAVFVRSNGDIYVADTGNNRILVFDSSGAYKSKIQSKPSGTRAGGAGNFVRGDLVQPMGVAVDGRGRVYTTSIDTGVIIYDARGRRIRQLPIIALQVYIKGNKTYIVSEGSIYVLNSRFDVVQHIGSKGRRLGQFVWPNDVVVDDKGNLIVSDSQNMRLQMFNRKGDLKAYIGKPPKDMNDNTGRLFGLGTGLDLDDAGRIYVADALGNSLRIFDKDGNDLGELGDLGKADDQFNRPSDIFYMGGNTFAVADKLNDRVQILRLNPGEARLAGTDAKPVSGQGLPTWSLYTGLLLLLAIIALTVRRLKTRRRYNQPLPG